MDKKRVYEIVSNGEICDVYYEKHPVWIQEVNNNMATIGFMDRDEEKNVSINDLSEDKFYTN